MKKFLLPSLVATTVILAGCKDEAAAPAETTAAPADAKPALTSNLQKVSYGIGLNLASSFKQQNLELDLDALQLGLQDGISGAAPAVEQQEIMQAMQEVQKEQMEKQQAEMKALEETNKAEATKFLTENAAKEGVVTTESGLQYKVVTAAGSDQKPTAEDTVVVHYKGTLLNGEEFDSSYSRNQPATFGVTNVIPGWTEALQLMSVGDKFELYIPSELAYGAGGAGQKIGPHAALVFEVELLEIVDPNGRQSAENAGEAPSAEIDKKVVEAAPAETNE